VPASVSSNQAIPPAYDWCILQGSLLEDFTPSVNPPKEIDDPTAKKPADWVDLAKYGSCVAAAVNLLHRVLMVMLCSVRIADPSATKPDDWDETAPALIPDPASTKPAGWLDDAPAQVIMDLARSLMS